MSVPRSDAFIEAFSDARDQVTVQDRCAEKNEVK
jgi:hypothetical protein